MLAEYSALRSEVDRRVNLQWNVVALQVTSAGVIASLAISRAADAALLLVIPLLSYMLGQRYILDDYYINLISRYIRDSLSGRLGDHLGWESWKSGQMESDQQQGHWPAATAKWRLLHPTRLVFEGVACLALLAVALAAGYAWRDRAPAWGLIVGFALLWIFDALATFSWTDHSRVARNHETCPPINPCRRPRARQHALSCRESRGLAGSD